MRFVYFGHCSQKITNKSQKRVFMVQKLDLMNQKII
jgi:hypothetical protein